MVERHAQRRLSGALQRRARTARNGPRRDPETKLLNPKGLADYAVVLADRLEPLLAAGEFPVVLGGDCSILLGCTLANRRRGRAGLLFLDGHA
ncbi:arginase family protein, partial [Lacticaseibacillus rhamnosus]